jgi:hypothetical protein
MRICVSVGSVTTAVPLLAIAIIVSLLRFEFLQYLVQRYEPLFPRSFEVLDPVVDRLEWLTIQPIHPLPPFVSDRDQAHLSKHPQVLGHLGLSQAQQADEVVDRSLPAGEEIQNLPASGFGDGIERIGSGSCSRHEGIIYPYGNMSTGAIPVHL